MQEMPRKIVIFRVVEKGWMLPKIDFGGNRKTLTVFDDLKKKGFSVHITILAIVWISEIKTLQK